MCMSQETQATSTGSKLTLVTERWIQTSPDIHSVEGRTLPTVQFCLIHSGSSTKQEETYLLPQVYPYISYTPQVIALDFCVNLTLFKQLLDLRLDKYYTTSFCVCSDFFLTLKIELIYLNVLRGSFL